MHAREHQLSRKISPKVALSGRRCLCAEHVLQLACMVFKAEAAAVTLMGKVCLRQAALMSAISRSAACTIAISSTYVSA